MKRFYKFLMPLVMIMALALPATLAAQTSCPIKIVGEDGYGDGWNGGSLAIVQGGTTLATFNAANADDGGMEIGAYDSIFVVVSDASPVTFVWTSGQYDEEVTIWIYDGDGTQLFTVTEPDPGTIYTLTAVTCPSCIVPMGFAMAFSGDDANFTWTAGTSTAWEFNYDVAGFNPDNTTTNLTSVTSASYTIDTTTLSPGFYEAYVRTDCGSDGYSAWVGPISFNVGIVIMNMATSGTDTLRSCNATIYDDGGPTGSYSSNCSSTLVIYPADNQHAVSVSGTSHTEGSWDYLRIYEGVGTNGTELWNDCISGSDQTLSFGPFLSADAITVTFYSDGSVTKEGFQINVSCAALPDCAIPETFVLEGVDSVSATFSWVDLNASEWAIGYGPAGFTLGDANTQWANFTDTTGTVTGLTPNTVYDFYLMAVCSNDSSWTRMLTARTACVAIDSLPYIQNFNSCPTGSSNLFDPCWSIYNTYSATANYPYVSSGYLYMYLYHASNVHQQYGYAMLPIIDESLNSVDLELTFDIWKSSTAGYNNGVIVGLFDGGVYDANHPIDTLAVIVPTATSQATAVTQYVVIPANGLSGKRLGFLYQNQDPNATSAYYYYTYIDNVNLHVAPTCSHVINLEVSAVTAGSAYVRWNPGPAGTYTGAIVEYRDTASSTWTTVNTAETYAVLSGLDSNTYYEVRVAADCGGDQAEYEYASFHTAAFGCIYDPDNTINVTVGNGTSTNSYIPSYSTYNYSYSQQFFTAHELGGSGSITQITLTPAAVGPQRTYEIYMGQSADSSASSFITPAGLTCVYNGGHVPLVAGQPVTFELTTPFNYSDTSNLVVIFRDMTGSWSSGTTWQGHTAWTNASRYVYRDASSYDVPQTSGGTASSFRNNITFFGGICLGISSCSAPAAWVNGVTRDSVYLEWIPGAEETSWDVYYELPDTVVYVGTTTDTHYDVGGLTGSTDYTFYIAAICNNEDPQTSVTVTTAPDDAYDVLPFVCTFDSLESVWLRAGDGQTNKWYIGTVNGERMLMVSDDNGASNSYSISSSSNSHAYARLVLPAGEYAYSFDWKAVGESCCDYLNAYIVPDSYTPVAGTNSIPASAIRIDGGVNLNQQSSWQTRSDIITISDSGVYKMVFTWHNDGSVGTNPPAAIDNVMLALNTCPRPSAIVLDSVTTSSVAFHWTDNSTTTTGGYKVEYNGIVDYTMATNYTATGLSASTGYTFRVYSICSGDDTSMAISLNAFTACGDVPIPYNEGFESYTAGTSTFPICWTNQSNTSNYVQDTYGVNSSNALHFAGPGVVVTPRVPLEGNRIVLSCWLRAESTTSSGSMHIGFTTNPTTLSDYVEIMEIQPSTTLTQYSDIYFDSASADTGYIVFKQDPSASTVFYWWLDDINVVDMGTCPRPNNLQATNATTNSVDLSWTDRGTPSSWIIEYGPMGFQLGTGTQIAANANPFTLTGLPSSYQGDFYVKAICGAGDTGDFSGTPGHFATTQIPATLPYNCDFENATEWANWQTSTNSATNNWFRGTAVADSGSYSMYVSADSGVTYKPYLHNAIVNAAAYRDVDFGPVDSSYTLSFRARVGGTIANYWDGLMVFLVDPAIPTIASESGITSPWGNVNDLYRIATVRLDTVWDTYEASFDTIHGVHRVAFFWFNQNTQSNSNGANLGEPAAVDNIHISYSTCPRPLNLDTVSVSGNNATLTWSGDPNANYEVIYRIPGNSNQFATTNTNSITLTGLNSSTTYYAWVRKLCGGGDTSLVSDGIAFTTLMCDNAEMYPNYDTTQSVYSSGSGYSPIGYSLYNYSYTQTIIDSATMAQFQGDITGFGFLPLDDNGASDFNGMDVYMANVSDSNLSSGFIHPDANHTFVQVIHDGNFNFTDIDWQYHSFDTVFTWDGHSNVLFAVNRKNGNWSSTTYFAAHTQGTGKMRYVYNDNGAYDINTVSGGTASTTVGDIMLISCGGGCHAPSALHATNVAYNSVTVAWSSSDSAEVGIHQGLWDVTGATITTVTTNSYTFTGLTPNTQYTVAVRNLCPDNMTSEWTYLQVTTDDLPCFAPTNVQVSNETPSGAKVTWTPGGNETEWLVNVYRSGVVDTNYTVINTPMCNVNGLYSAMTYTVKVGAVCGGIDTMWSETTTLTTTACLPPTNVEAVANGHQAIVTWEGSGANEYHVLWFLEDFTTDGDSVIVTNGNTNATIDGLEGGETYDIYVYAYCDGQRSAQAGQTQLHVTGIDDINTNAINLYPNPANTTVTVDGIKGEALVTIVDMNGRTVFSEKTVSSITIDLNGMAKGAYFVRITGENSSAIRKLIVK